MSQLLIQQYLNQLSTLRKVSGTTRESVVREAFKDLLKGWARSHDLIFVPEHEVAAPTKERRYVDGALMHTLRVPFGYWEAKDTEDDLDAAIEKKFRAGYPKTNIIFENSRQAVLIQHGQEVMRCFVEDVIGLEKLLKLFFAYERPEIEAFRKAVEQFKVDLPAVVEALRQMIEAEFAKDPKFRKAAQEFLTHVQEAVNPSLTEADVREMLIQHVLTGEVFAAVFPGTTYHADNNIARELHKLEATFFTGNTRFQTLKGLEPYYTAIRKAASEIQTHSEKQTFLKAIYENFYKVYNPKAADRLGVVYTPNEIVRFMIEGADWLCEKHFGRNLIDHDVQIFDPATGTGTFICELLEHFRGQKTKLAFKYQNELHANEVAILPYYVANLNIEATYAAITGEYKEFPNLCFVDTLDNTYGLRKHKGHMDDIFGSMSDINVQRIRNQNAKRISVIIGNPPYSAWQENFNFKNPNRPYMEIDKRIRATYQEAGTAQNQIGLYDMYVRFFRWATDRLDEDGILIFISNRSFIDSRAFDGFRKTVAEEFCEIWMVDLGGDVRENPKLSGTRHNVFGIQTGVTITWLVRRKKQKGCRIYYARRPELETAEEKLSFLSNAKLEAVAVEEITPDKKFNWIGQGDADYEKLLPTISKREKGVRGKKSAAAIFGVSSRGMATQRDEWVYDNEAHELESKMRYFIDSYELARHGKSSGSRGQIKWDRELERYRDRGIPKAYDAASIRKSLYRPFVTQMFYFDRHFNAMTYQWGQIPLEPKAANRIILYTQPGSQKPFMVGATDLVCDLHFVGAGAATECLPFFRITEDGEVSENVSEWAVEQFRKHYQPGRGKKAQPITKEAIFHYVYAVLHDPIYREKYALNLKREFPRIPFYLDFWKWAEWGKELIQLHIGYEAAVPPYNLKRNDVPDEKARKAGMGPKCVLKADKEAGRIVVDSEATLTGIPSQAWEYRLGNRSALEWVLDQYKESTPKDPTIREKFNTYRFADYKEKVIDLLGRVTTVSVETQRIIEAMRKAQR